MLGINWLKSPATNRCHKSPRTWICMFDAWKKVNQVKNHSPPSGRLMVILDHGTK